MNSPTISVITASFNASDCINDLIESLRNQTDSDFNWIIADGDSTDSTLSILNSVTNLDIIISSEADFGIYDALNRAIKLSDSDYYVVAGADDKFEPRTIENFKKEVKKSGADIIAANMILNGVVCSPRKTPAWLTGHKSYVAEHAVATLFKRELHNQFGFYSNGLPIASDHLFIQTCINGDASIKNAEFVAGFIGNSGVSTLDAVGAISESFRVQIRFYNKFIQFIIYIARLIIHYKKL
jgi:glycosyltransferase involved in cell wall biosynthesis